MLYYSNDPKIKKIVNDIFDNSLPSDGRVNFSVCYSQNRRMSIVVIEMSKTSLVHALMFFYSRSYSLYDVIRYKQKQWKRLGTSGSPIDEIHKLNKLILKKIPLSNPQGERRIKEELLMEAESFVKDHQIKRLRDQLKIARDQNQSLRNQIKFIKKRSDS